MNLDNVLVADLETDGLLHEVTKLHVMSVGWKNSEGVWQIKSTNKQEDVEKVFCNPDNIIVMHNGRRYDKIAVEKIYGIKVTATIIDSLALSWWLYPTRAKEGKKFGLAYFGEDYGIPKPIVEKDEWKGVGKDKEDIIEYYERLNRGKI